MNWSLLVATYNRTKALRNCVQFAIAQSRPPAEIVIVDASDTWEAHRQMVLEDRAGSAGKHQLALRAGPVARPH